jgi:intermediate cleaving peptidase 55
MTMFVAPKNASIEMWEGARTGIDAAKEIFGADEVRAICTLTFSSIAG